MANIVELREMSNEKLEEMLENSREEMFNLRFQKAAARLENTIRIKQVRREIAQLQTVLNNRALVIEMSISEPAIFQALQGKDWQATTRFVYEDSAWSVQFVDVDGNELASALVDLNKKQPKGRKARQNKLTSQLVINYEIAG
jgi:large subunit ribosomal protein L29